MNFFTEDSIKLDIKNKMFRNCYVFFGNEQYMIRHYVSKICDSAVNTMPELNVSYYEGNAVKEVFDCAVTFPFMAEKRVVKLCDFPIAKASANEFNALLELIENLPQYTILIIWFETVEINPKKLGEKAKKLFSAVEKSGGRVCQIMQKNSAELIKIIQNSAAKRGVKIDLPVARYMVDNCSQDVGSILFELEKLCAFAENGEVTLKMVEDVCCRSVEASVYALSKQLLRQDLDGALKTISDLFYVKIKPTDILWNLAGAYIDIYRTFAAKTEGKRASASASALGYSQNIAFRLDNAEKDLKNFSEKQLVDSLKEIQKCDARLKDNGMDSRTAIENLIVTLVVIMRNA